MHLHLENVLASARHGHCRVNSNSYVDDFCLRSFPSNERNGRTGTGAGRSSGASSGGGDGPIGEPDWPGRCASSGCRAQLPAGRRACFDCGSQLRAGRRARCVSGFPAGVQLLAGSRERAGSDGGPGL